MTVGVDGDAFEVDVEGSPAEVVPLTGEDEVIEVDDTVMQTKKDIRELRERLLRLRRQVKNASKQDKRTLQGELAACEREEDEKRRFLEQEQNKVRGVTISFKA